MPWPALPRSWMISPFKGVDLQRKGYTQIKWSRSAASDQELTRRSCWAEEMDMKMVMKRILNEHHNNQHFLTADVPTFHELTRTVQEVNSARIRFACTQICNARNGNIIVRNTNRWRIEYWSFIHIRCYNDKLTTKSMLTCKVSHHITYLGTCPLKFTME